MSMFTASYLQDLNCFLTSIDLVTLEMKAKLNYHRSSFRSQCITGASSHLLAVLSSIYA